MGAKLDIGNDYIKVLPSDNIKGTKLETKPYPGFPTDLQAQMMALMSIANGQSQIKEKIFENRFMHVSELIRLGAKIIIKNDTAFKYINAFLNTKFEGGRHTRRVKKI